MAEIQPFTIVDCSLARQALGRNCSNLREVLDAVRNVPDAVLEHHLLRCPLEDHFELYEFPNDLARWCWEALNDPVLAEKLGLVDPYKLPGINELRAVLVETIEDHLWGVDRVNWCRPGFEWHIISSRLVAFETGEHVPTPVALAEAIGRMSTRSLFYHVHEARRRTGGKTDDFSIWLEQLGANPDLVAAIRAIDFYFLNLNQLRAELTAVFQHYFAEAGQAEKPQP